MGSSSVTTPSGRLKKKGGCRESKERMEARKRAGLGVRRKNETGDWCAWPAVQFRLRLRAPGLAFPNRLRPGAPLAGCWQAGQ